jgi:C1A family cysteine protease
MPRPTNVAIPKYHWRPDPPDSRDYLYAAPQMAVPALVDLRPGCSPIENQGQLGSCTGQAIAGLIEYMDRKAKKNLDVSRLFIYYQERLLEGTVNYDSGAYIRDGIKAVNKFGAPLESLWPYVIGRFAMRPSATAYTDALKRRVGAYRRITDFAGVKTALAQGFPVVMGFSVYESFQTTTVARTGQMPYPNVQTEQLLGGHAVALVGYQDSTQQFIARNSWGTGWGDGGYFYMPYQVVQNTSMSSDFWIITSVNNP